MWVGGYLVHRLAEVDAVHVHRAHERARVADDERPDDRAEEHDDDRDDELGRVLRGDVAVAGCRDGYRRVVERVEEPDLVARVVDVAISAEQHDERNENDQ